MAVGDGTTWDETTPTDATYAISIDDYNRDVRLGVRGRMALEHEWPASQSATSEGGKHKFITLQEQAAKPTIAGTQLAAVYIKTSGAGLQELFYEDEGGRETQITAGTGVSGGSVLDAWATPATSGQATADGFFVFINTSDPAHSMTLFTDSGNPASTLRAEAYADSVNVGNQSGMSPIKSGDYWLLVGGATAQYYMIPMIAA